MSKKNKRKKKGLWPFSRKSKKEKRVSKFRMNSVHEAVLYRIMHSSISTNVVVLYLFV